MLQSTSTSPVHRSEFRACSLNKTINGSLIIIKGTQNDLKIWLRQLRFNLTMAVIKEEAIKKLNPRFRCYLEYYLIMHSV